MNDTPAITQQYAFSVDEDGEMDGIEAAEESVETSLETFGADVDHRERDSRIDKPEASSFGVDDRKTVTRSDGGDQHTLFANTEDDQQTLTGERAASQCLFKTDEQDHDRDDEHAEEPDTASDEATDMTNEASPRAVATDGGRVEDDTDPEDTNTSETVMVAIPRMKLAEVTDALDRERETIERNAGEGPRTEKLSRFIAECRTGLGLLGINDDTATISRVVAAAAADELETAAETETGEYAAKLRKLAHGLQETLDNQPPSDERERADDRKTNGENDGYDDDERVTDDRQDETPDADTSAESASEPGGEETAIDPHQHVPDRIDYITADGIEQVHDHLSDENATEYAEASVEEQAAFLWEMVDRDVIDLSLGSR